MQGLQEWWTGLTAGWQLVIMDALVLALALLSTRLIVKLVKGALTAKGFDDYLQPPWSLPPSHRVRIRPQPPPVKRITPSECVAYLSVATVWMLALWFTATLHGLAAFGDTLQRLVGVAWILALVVVASMLIGGWISRAVYGLCQSSWLKARLKEEEDDRIVSDATPSDSFSQFIGRTIGMAVYFVVFLLALLTATEVLRLTTVSNAVLAFWELALRLLTAGAAVGIGLLGVTWARAQSASAREGGETDVRIGYQVGLGIIAGTVALSILLLGGGSNFYAGIFIILVLGLLAWSLRRYIRDLWAGLFLKGQAFKEIAVDGVPFEVRRVGPLMTELVRDDEVVRKRNRDVLAAALAGEKEDRKRAIAKAYEKLKRSADAKRSRSTDSVPLRPTPKPEKPPPVSEPEDQTPE